MIQDTIQSAIALVLDGKLGQALSLLEPIFETHTRLRDRDEVESISTDYHTMLSFMRRNADDPDRNSLYRSLLKRTYRVAADLEVSWRCRNVAFYTAMFHKADHLNMSPDFIRTVLETYVSDLAMLSLSADGNQQKRKEIMTRHQTFIERLFAALTVACQWSRGERDFWQQLLLSPTIDASDALVITSAITISAMNLFDANKTSALATIYREAQDTPLRERALIGFVMSLDDRASSLFEEEKDAVRSTVSSKGAAHELFELQEQIYYCANAESDNRKIKDELLPGLTANAPFRVTRSGMIEERDYDRMREIMHPDADDKAMADIEASMNKIAEMQRQGSDVYFGGFSQMKRFPFFNEAANWFMPYSKENPSVSTAREKLGNGGFIDMVIAKSSFCESDKYSFTFAVAAIFDRMPPKLREMLDGAEVAGISVSDEEARKPTFIRRQYLQDLYRFFMLYNLRGDIANPFDLKGRRAFFFDSGLFLGTEVDALRPKLAVFLNDQHRYDDLKRLLWTFTHRQKDTLTYELLEANVWLHAGKHAMALTHFKKALNKDPQNEMALNGLARSAMTTGDYQAASDAYASLLELHPGRKSLLVNRGLALLYSGHVDDAAKPIYEADYRYPDDTNVRRVKAWLLLCQHRTDEAVGEYRVLTGGKPLAEDYLNMGYAMWFSGDIGAAEQSFRTYLGMNADANIESDFNSDSALLASYGITSDDRALMEELLGDNRTTE